MTGTDLCVNKPPTTSLFWKGHQDASRTLEKMCWLRRGVRWRLTCASKCLAIMVLNKSVPIIFESPCITQNNTHLQWHKISIPLHNIMVLGQLSQYSELLGAGRSWDRILTGARFSTPIQTGPVAHPASYTMGTGSFPGVKQLGHDVDHPPHLAPR
jgi:hypothetical protein